MNDHGAPLLRIYKAALVLYPSRFRRAYEGQVLQTLRDARREEAAGLGKFWLKMFSDLFRSVCVERSLMLREQMLKRPIFLHAFILGLILTAMGGAAALTAQQMLRRGANQPQMEMVNFYASEILSGTTPEDAIPPGYVDPARSLQPFVVFYDEQGKIEKSTGYLDGDNPIPAPPAGVFEYVRTHGSDTITWQPRRGVRIATVAKYVAGPHPGYLLAGRSLSLTEGYESLLWRITFSGWFVIVLLLISGATLLNRAQRVVQQGT